MCRPLHTLLLSLTRTTHAIKELDQILTQTIITGLIHTNPTWNCILRAYSKSPKPIKAIIIYSHFIKSNSIYPDNYTFPVLLKACARLFLLPKGKEVHAHLTKLGLDSDVYVQNSLIHFYGSTGQPIDAHLVFDNMPQRDVTSWNTLLATYKTNSDAKNETMVLFRSMLCEGIRADKITMVTLLTACAQIGKIDCGKVAHACVIKVGIRGELNLENALLGVYARCGEMNAAMKVLNEMNGRRDIVSYTILINGYVEMGLVDLARDIFNRMVDKDLVSWNSIIHGYVIAKRPKEALELFKEMESEMVLPDETTIVSVIAACATLSDLQYGKLVHRFILQNNIRQDLIVGTALIDMYSKCGSLELAMVTFFKMECKDIFTWTTIIEGLANYGYASEALRMFNQMEEQGTKPNEATFVSVLTACRQSGLVNEGCYLFKRMVGLYKIQPKIEHLGCLIDLLSRAGLLHQAEEFLKIMPPEERLIAYKTLLSACMSYSRVELGLKVADELIRLTSQSHAVYILLSNFYALAGQWDKVADIRKNMKELDMKKAKGISSIEVEP